MREEECINILMVDDSPTNLLALESILQASDRNLIRASSGEEALRYLLDHDAAVVLLDVYMPGIDGLETAKLIRSRKKSRSIPIIFLTANTTGGRHLSRGYSLGAVDYIVKPIEPEILRSKVAVLVELFKKNQQIKRQAQLLQQKNLELESVNIARLNMLIDLGHELAAEQDPSKVLEKFCCSARRIVGVEKAAVGVVDNGRNTLRYSFDNSHKGTTSPDEIQPFVQRALNRMIVEGRPLRITEADDFTVTREPYHDWAQSFLGAPILSGSGVSGWVYLLNRVDGDDFSETDERLAATLATQVGVAYENARLYAEAQSHAAALRSEMAVRKQAEAERTQLLVREQAARAEAERANRTKDEFLAMLSHELRTPLSAILGWSRIVRTNKLGEDELAHGLETIERNARVQAQLIDDLLDVSRIISGKLEIETRMVNLSTVIEAAIDSVRPAFTAKEIQFETARESPASLVLGDGRRLQQVFWNLFSNAVKFTPNRGQVKITVKRREADVQISVTDTGVGISSEFLPYVFDRFRQADGSTTRTQGGLGLGLAIVRHLVELHQGRVEVASGDTGSTFTVTLPLASAATRRDAVPELEEPTCAELTVVSSRLLEGLKILVVDDEADSRNLITTILTDCGSEVRCSESVAEAIRAFQEWNPDLLVSDIALPNEDGYSLIKKLRKLRSKRAMEIPAVALTAYATDHDRSLALAAGFQMHLAKPIEPGTLVTSIAAVLGHPLSR